MSTSSSQCIIRWGIIIFVLNYIVGVIYSFFCVKFDDKIRLFMSEIFSVAQLTSVDVVGGGGAYVYTHIWSYSSGCTSGHKNIHA